METACQYRPGITSKVITWGVSHAEQKNFEPLLPTLKALASLVMILRIIKI